MNRVVLDNPENDNEKFVIEVKNNGVNVVKELTTKTSETVNISDTESEETIITVINRKVGQRIENFNNL